MFMQEAMVITRSRRLWPAVIATACLLGLLNGCGRASGPPRYVVSGQVTFRDMPVPVGEIIFRPDAEAGNEGPGSVATIRDGAYTTESGRGLVGGPYVVEIVGFDGVSVAEATEGGVLFNPISRKINFPKADSTRDFSLP